MRLELVFGAQAECDFKETELRRSAVVGVEVTPMRGFEPCGVSTVYAVEVHGERPFAFATAAVRLRHEVTRAYGRGVRGCGRWLFAESRAFGPLRALAKGRLRWRRGRRAWDRFRRDALR